MTEREIELRRMRLNNRINRMEQKTAEEPSVKKIIAKCKRELRNLDKK